MEDEIVKDKAELWNRYLKKGLTSKRSSDKKWVQFDVGV